jgi:hypothetical protein
VAEEDRWIKLEQVVEKILRKVLREELAALGKAKVKLSFEGGRWVGVTDEQLLAWKEAYGALDIEQELKKAAAWIVSNPPLAPKSNFGRFLNTWLSRNQNQMSLQSIPRHVPSAIQRKSCAYCPKGSVGNRNGYEHCDDHAMAALDGDKPMGAVRQRA